jgi:hypothetical protein
VEHAPASYASRRIEWVQPQFGSGARAAAPPGVHRGRGDEFLRKRWFEIQVRSLLEHAWAEIEHEIVYKSGITQPDAVRRRFAALAGSLELFDSEFEPVALPSCGQACAQSRPGGRVGNRCLTSISSRGERSSHSHHTASGAVDVSSGGKVARTRVKSRPCCKEQNNAARQSTPGRKGAQARRPE